MEPFADGHGFVVIFPNGTSSPTYWNLTLDQRGADDVGYLRALIGDAGRRLCIDRRRVFMTGMSNGAGMTSAAACHLADIVAAFAPVAGVHGPDTCGAKARAVALVAFHGTADPYLSYTGGFGPQAGKLPIPKGTDLAVMARYPSPDREQAVRSWATFDGCGPAATTNESSEVRVTRYAGCRDHGAIALYSVIGGGHSWPGSAVSVAAASIVGKTTTQIDANQVMWDFFSAHPLT
jgi:polyhydroxybutyrate depolymerase